MDPNANLKAQLDLVRRIQAAVDLGDATDLSDEADELATLVEALDGWLRSGGYLPARWVRK